MSVNTQGKAKLGARSDSGACGPFRSFGSDRQTEPQAQLMDMLVCNLHRSTLAPNLTQQSREELKNTRLA